MASVVAAYTRDDRDLTARLLDHNPDNAHVFLLFKRRRLTRRATRNKEVNPFPQLKLHQPAERVHIDRAVTLEGSDEGRAASPYLERHRFFLPYGSFQNLAKAKQPLFGNNPARGVERPLGK